MKNIKDELIIELVSKSHSYAEVIRGLGLTVGGRSYSLIKEYISRLNLDISHFTGKIWNVGNNYRSIKKAIDLKDILIEHSPYTNINFLRFRLLNEKVKEYKCECCGNTHWLGKPICLELHHINGVKDDLRIENLQILCPNCHSLTENYRGRKLRARVAKW